MAISVVDATGGERELALFLSVPNDVYRDDPYYCPPFRESVVAGLRRSEFTGLQKLLVALDHDRPVARIVARRAPELRDDNGRPFGMLGGFEALDHAEAANALFAESVAWLRRAGAGTIVGPIDGDTWHSYRLNVGPFDREPFLMEPYNPPYYPALWETNGFAVLAGYHSKQVDDATMPLQVLEPLHRQAIAAGYRLEPLRFDHFERELDRLHAMSCEIFRGNYLYTAIDRQRFGELYAGARRLIDPQSIWFAVGPDGSDAGFLFAVPDRIAAVRAMRGRRGPLALLRFLLLRRRTDAMNLKSLGVLPEHRRTGLASALMYLGYLGARRRGYRRVNLCLIKDDNASSRFDAGRGRLLRRYHLYQYAEEGRA